MQTNFSPEQLKDSAVANSERILRKCVHCGFCTATCPTFTLLGDELDSPRGRIYLIKDMLENDRPADAQVVKHIDRCLSCLSCMTTCPSGVHYMHLIDHARAHIERTYKRPPSERLMRLMLAVVLPFPNRFRLALKAASLVNPMAGWLRGLGGPFKNIGAMLALTPDKPAATSEFQGQVEISPKITKVGRVAILQGCAQPVLAPSINDATVRLLTRLGYEVVFPEDVGCCGALVHHMGHEKSALNSARGNVDAWFNEINDKGLDAILITASGCGTTIKDYGFMLRDDADYAKRAEQVSKLTLDITEFLSRIDLGAPHRKVEQVVAYHSACSMQHGQKITEQPKRLLEAAGFTVKAVPEGHLCCGSAGTYNILQPDIADQLKERKVANIESTSPDVIAAGNIGCITQIAGGTKIPVIHSAELLDWAYGGPKPQELR
ncbi:glycolate oxidase subunit GlcF [Flexibacterium corallicola]|uniref:glycolate oxidase subunit GlcF n=1 Tax=Flexibacterium corallicola TaxID=3037259 RepID=UPI00286F4A51|nr:glycolate oxidase subunit GlcF [Pseudovibrio sp. M1P-2-3]